MLGTTNVLDFRIFWIVEHLHMHNKIYGEWDPNCAHNSFVLYALYTVVQCACVLTTTSHMRSGMEFSTCGIVVVFKVQILEHFRFFFFFSTGAWTQGLHLEPLYQSFFCVCERGFFKIGSLKPGWLRTVILLVSTSWVARITGMRHQRPALDFRFSDQGCSIWFQIPL
jgi:hypothetical protein